ncbi:type II toxin-antitoxin system PemK/MazF family toxin [Candidatus Pacearchaeota archaeon]|nr:type II toxin-antitoxin system PemK/MazF family toxin [Candidatus Pacearchaeota archaeon]
MKGGMMYKQGEIILVPFPYSDLTSNKLRPALIISNAYFNRTEDRICCLITSNEPKEGILIKGENFSSGKLPFKSWVKPQRVFTLNERIIRKKLCVINKEFHKKILDELYKYLKTDLSR